MKMQGLYKPYIEQYLDFKRSLGYKLRDVEYIFIQFDRLTIVKSERSIGITKELSDEWCEKRPNESLGTRYARVSQLSLFARFLCEIGIPSYIPEVPRFQTRDAFVPYIFSKDEIGSIFSEIDRFVPENITPDAAYAMMPTLFRLLYGTGLRLGEALELEVRHGKAK
jgi:integrase/recombinase XerD